MEEHKQAEEALRSAELEKETILNSLVEHVIHEDTTMKILWANQAACESAGLPLEELIGRHCYEIWPKRSTPCPDCPVVKAMETGQPQKVEKTTPDGRSWFIRGCPVLDANGDVTGAVEVTLEITERKKAEKALRQERERLEIVTQNIGAGLTIISKDYRILWANKLMKGFYGDVEGKVCYSTFHQRTSVCPGCGVKEIFETGKNQVVHEQTVKYGDQQIWLEITATPIRDENGNITAVLELSVYITKRKQMEEKLRESEEKYRNLFENARDVIFTADLKGNITDINRFVEEYGFKRDEVVGKNMLKFVSKKYWPRLLKDLAKISQGKPIEGEVKIITPKGKKIAESRSNPIRLGEKVVGFQTILRNITERKKMEETLRKSEEKYRSIVELAPDSIITFDTKGVITSCNAAATRISGYSKDELVGKHFTKIGPIRARDIPKYLKMLPSTVKGKVPKPFEVTYRRKDGTTAFGEVRFSLMREKGKIVGIQAIMRDITEQKKAEEKLRKSEKSWSDSFNSLEDVMIIIGKDYTIEKMNDSGLTLLGKTREEVVGKKCYQVIHDRNVPCEFCSFKRTLKTGKLEMVDRYEKLFDKHFNIKSSPISNERGEIVRFVDLMRDITDRKKAEKALRESEEKYRELINGMNDTAWVIGFDGKFIDVNEAAVKVLGYSREELFSMGPPDIDNTLTAEQIRDLIKRMPTDEIQVFQTAHTTKDGKTIPVEISSSLVTYKGKQAILSIARDITERKRAEEELIRLSSAVRMSNDSVVISDLDGTVLDVNEATLKMYGTDDKRDLIGKNSFDLIAPEERERALAGMKEVLEKGYLKSREYDIITKDGGRIPVEMSVAIMKDADGKPIGFVGISRDTTERKKMEETLKCQRDIAITLSGAGDLIEALNRLFDNLLEIEEFDCAGFYLVDKDTGELDMIVHRGLPDRFVEKVSHFDADSPYTKVAMEGKPIYQKTGDFPPSIREDLQSDGILGVAAIPIQYEGEVIGHLNMASYTHDEISASTRHVLESVGAHIGETIVRVKMEEKLRQYSERLEELVQKRTEELLESEKRYSVLVEEASDEVVIIQEGKIVLINKRASDISGYSKDELIGLSFEKLLSERCRQLVTERYMRRLRGEAIPATYEVEFIAKTSERIPVEVSATLIHYEGRPADLVIIRDIRERKRMEEQRLKLERLATLGELATMVGHDLRNPLQAITNAVYILKDSAMTADSALASEPYEKARSLLPKPILSEIRQRVKNFREEQNKTIQTIDESVKYADKIVSDLQDFARIKESECMEVDLKSLIQETLSDISIPENVKVSTRHDKHLSKLYGDPNQIRRIFTNLTTNAIQAMPHGGKLTISTSLTNGFASIAFQDTGVGIPKESMKKLFTPLFTTRAKGMGMGLAICKKFVESHGGIIKVESEEGKGSTFTVKLPIQRKIGGEK